MRHLALWSCVALLVGCGSTEEELGSSNSNLDAVLVKESVKCVFDSKTEEECVSAKGSCKGLGSCLVDIAGTMGEKVEWKSTCGGYAITILDGNSETALFDCGVITPPPPPPPEVKEQVKCVFKNATTVQECYSARGACKGLGTCVVDVTGFKGEKLEWKSSCGGYATTLMDGISEYALFDCLMPPPPPLLKEQVKCVFKNSKTVEECYSAKGACKGLGTCIVDVAGFKGEKVLWKSSCGGYATTLMDGLSEYAEFDCGLPPPPPPPPGDVKEQVKCVFKNSALTVIHECYSAKGGCKGSGTCVVDLVGWKGEKVEWKSSCGGYAITVMDGLSEYAEFDCGGLPPPPPPPPPQLKEQVKCVFKNATTAQECYSMKGGCKGIGTCIVDLLGFKGEKVEWKSSCGGYATTLMDGISEYAEFDCGGLPPPPPPPPPDVKEQVKCVFKNAATAQECMSMKGGCKGIGSCIVDVVGWKGEKVEWKSSCGGYATTLMDGLSEYAAFDCAALPPPPPPPPPPLPDVKEQVKCVFKSNLVQECYSAKGSCKGLGSCIVDVAGFKGEKVEWKSSCGGYATTLMDGLSESAFFACPL